MDCFFWHCVRNDGASMHRYGFLEHVLFPPVFLNKKKLMHKLAGKTVLITGASSGIGASLAWALANFPVHLILVARSHDKLSAIKDKIEKENATVSIFCADLRNREELAKLVAFLQQLPDKPDFFISNAGKSIRRSIHDSLDRFHDFARTMAVNYFAPVELLLSLIPMLAEKKRESDKYLLGKRLTAACSPVGRIPGFENSL